MNINLRLRASLAFGENMISGLLGRKLGMTQIFDPNGNVIPVTAIEVGPCVVLDVKEEPKKKVVLGFEEIKESRCNKAQVGFFNKIEQKPMRTIREFNSSDNTEYVVGQELKADLFKPGDYVDVTGRSVGKGFQGGMKRWGWSGGKASHGSMHHRRVGSSGQCATPSRILKGKTMPGRMGSERVTVQSLRVMEVDLESNVVLVKGAVPGHKRGLIEVKKSRKKAWRDLTVKSENVAKKRNPMKQSKAKAKGKK